MITFSQILTGVAFSASLWAADSDKALAAEPSHDFVVIDYDGQKVPDTLDGMMRYNTVIRLPKGEKVTEAAAGAGADLSKPGSGDWLVVSSDEGDAVYIRPTHPGVATNIEIRTDHGNRYTFFVHDHTNDKGFRCHLEYVLNPTGQGILDNIKAPPKFVEADKYNEAKAETEKYRGQIDSLQRKWQRRFEDAEATATHDVLSGLVCDYDLAHSRVTESPFNVSNICHNGTATFIWAKGAAEHFSVQAEKQGTPAMIIPEYDPKTGIYTIRQVLDKGVLQVGNGKKTKKAEFMRANG